MKCLTLIISVFFLINSCSLIDNFKRKEEGVKLQELTIDKSFKAEKETDYKIKEASILGSILTLKIEYIGGAGKHRFDLMFNEMYSKSMPPIANLYLVHNIKGELGNKVTTKTLKYEISEAKYYKGEKTIIKIYTFPDKLTLKHNE